MPLPFPLPLPFTAARTSRRFSLLTVQLLRAHPYAILYSLSPEMNSNLYFFHIPFLPSMLIKQDTKRSIGLIIEE